MGLMVDPWMWSLALVVLVLSVLLSSLCSHCGRRSFELRDTAQEKGPSALVSVVKLEEAAENPLSQMGKDGLENDVGPWSIHLGAPQATEISSEAGSGTVPAWRSHLGVNTGS